jgi:hypothetical protein
MSRLGVARLLASPTCDPKLLTQIEQLDRAQAHHDQPRTEEAVPQGLSPWIHVASLLDWTADINLKT